MKTLFIESQKKDFENINRIDKELEKVPSEIFIAYSIQYKQLALNIRNKLAELGKTVQGFKQVLGCSKLKLESPILLISSGKFHALNLLLQENVVYMLEKNKLRKIDNKEIERYKKQKKAAKLKFLSADKIGILVSCKSGQEQMKKAENLKKKLENQGKSATIFIADNINLGELENYNIDSWVNTACPGLFFDSSDSNLLNLQEL